MSDIKPYKISVPQEKLDRLQHKLALTDLPDEIDGSGWTHGSSLADIKRLVKYWQEEFDWRKAEAGLNKYPQFTTPIEVNDFGIYEVHFIHQESDTKNAIPLCFIHGWPGSFDEVLKILPELVKGGKDFPSFHVVAPSAINFGFSQGCTKASAFFCTWDLMNMMRLRQTRLTAL